MTKAIRTVEIDRSKWRTGGCSRYATGLGVTRLQNDTTLCQDAMTINDSDKTTIQEKEKKLKALFKGKLKLVFKGRSVKNKD
jgi:hypothetical protein